MKENMDKLKLFLDTTPEKIDLIDICATRTIEMV